MPMETYVKHAKAGLLGEACALRWLSEAEDSGGMRVVRVLEASDTKLVLERIVSTRPTPTMAEAAGVALAHTHAAGAPFWGAPPRGWQGAYVIDFSETPCVKAENGPINWGFFYSRYRIQLYINQLPKGFFSPSDLSCFEHLCKRLEAGEFDAPQPALVGERPARLHGDLWAGNLLWSKDSPTGAVLIDPMSYGGHAESDLAMLALFGCAYLGTLVAAYNEESPLADGWQERILLMQLAPLLHHCVLFGAQYRSKTLLALSHYE